MTTCANASQIIRSLGRNSAGRSAILLDLQGPKLRIGLFKTAPSNCSVATSFVLDSDPTPGDATRVYLPHPEILQRAAAGPRRADR